MTKATLIRTTFNWDWLTGSEAEGSGLAVMPYNRSRVTESCSISTKPLKGSFVPFQMLVASLSSNGD